MTTNLLPVSIIGVGYHAPERIMKNAEFETFLETSDEWIRERTGIRERRIAPDDHALSDLAIPAARQAISHAGIAPSEIDLIVVATSTPDMYMPSTASIVQKALGIKSCPCFDMEAACTGFVYAMTTASQFLATGKYRTALVIGGDLLSKFLTWNDRSTAVLFGDGAGAVVLRGGEEEGLLATYLGADGEGGRHLELPIGSRVPPGKGNHGVRMNGKEIYKFAVDIIPKSVKNVLEQSGMTLEQVDHFILHQANLRIMEAAAKRMGVSMDRLVINIDRMANTSAGTIPVALAEAVVSGRIQRGDTICLVGFGSGLTWASALLRWTCDPPFPEEQP